MEGIGTFLFLAAVLSPLFGLGAAVYYFLGYRGAPEPKGTLLIASYCLRIAGGAVVAFIVGSYGGILVACNAPNTGNLCGLYGYFLTGPLLTTAVIIFLARTLTKRAQLAP